MLRRIEKISQNSKSMWNLVKDKKLQKSLKKITNLKSYLFKDKLNFKFPGAGGFDPHIDGHFIWKDKNNKVKKKVGLFMEKILLM